MRLPKAVLDVVRGASGAAVVLAIGCSTQAPGIQREPAARLVPTTAVTTPAPPGLVAPPPAPPSALLVASPPSPPTVVATIDPPAPPVGHPHRRHRLAAAPPPPVPNDPNDPNGIGGIWPGNVSPACGRG